MVSVVEVLTGTTASGTATATVTTSLLPDDLVILLTSQYGLSGQVTGAVTPSGLGTWSAELLELTTVGRGMEVRTLTGVTGGGSITLTVGSVSSTYESDYVIVVARSFDEDPVFDRGMFTLFADPELHGATAGPLEARADTLAIAVMGSFSVTNYDFPAGWTVDRDNGRLGVAHYFPVPGEYLEPTLATPGGASTSERSVAILTFGAPLEPRLQASGVEALVTGTNPDRALSGSGVEVLTNGATAAEAELYGSGIEALFGGAGSALLAAAGIEVLTTRVYVPPPAGSSYRGWGIPI